MYGHNEAVKKKTIVICPYLGSINDPAANFGEPSDAQRCYSPKEPGKIALEYQQTVCLTSGYCDCNRFVQDRASRELIPAAEIPVKSPVPVIEPPQALAVNPWRELVGYWARAFLQRGPWLIPVVLSLGALYIALPFLYEWIEPMFVARQNLALVSSTPMATETPSSTATRLPTATLISTPVPTPERTSAVSLVIPTPPPSGMVMTLMPNSALTGWVVNSDSPPHWGDRILLAGSLENETFSAVLNFDLANLPPGSEIVYAALELTGRDASKLGTSGAWQLELVDGENTTNWADQSSNIVSSTAALAVLGEPLAASDLGVGHTNYFVFGAQDLALFQDQLAHGSLTFRLRPTWTESESLFGWSGSSSAGGLDVPILYVVAIPKPWVVITNTPFPTNVLTAAAQAVRGTAQAQKLGTPTPFPRGVATATLAPDTVFVPPPPTPANAATRVAESMYATAVAITTGTFTPTPANMVIAYPTATPILIPIEQIVPPATLTPTSNVDYFATPIPESLLGKILVQSDRLGPNYQSLPLVLDETGNLVAILSSSGYYVAAAARESFAPDRKRRAIVAPDAREILQVWILDLQTNNWIPVTNVSRGIAYDPVWSPDGTRIAYVSTQTGIAEIYVYDIATKTSKQLTTSESSDFYNQRPSWSPDSQKLVFKSNRSDVTRFQIYMMRADGTELQNISLNQYDELDPIWIKP